MMRVTLRTGSVIDGEVRGSGRNWIAVNDAGTTYTIDRADIIRIEYASGLVENFR